jgi:hypothetical protein
VWGRGRGGDGDRGGGGAGSGKLVDICFAINFSKMSDSIDMYSGTCYEQVRIELGHLFVIC